MSRRVLLTCMGIGLAVMLASSLVPVVARESAFVVYNPTDSVPRGWYRVSRAGSVSSMPVGTIVLARLPAEAAAFAGQRGYLPAGVPILKRIGATPPQTVCVHEHRVHIDGAWVATARTHDGAHRPMQAWAHCRPLSAGELFLLSDTNPVSFDSRYFGPIARASVLGIAKPLWTWSTP